MKRLFVLPLILLFVCPACSKDDLYGPWKLENGQVVELLVSHRYAGKDAPLLLLPQNEPAQMSLYSFTEREPGYSYRVKARMVVPDVAPQDGPSYHLEFIEVLSREKYEGNESFEISLIQSFIPGGPRSEEHTSELQSLMRISYAVFCLKKTKQN